MYLTVISFIIYIYIIEYKYLILSKNIFTKSYKNENITRTQFFRMQSIVRATE